MANQPYTPLDGPQPSLNIVMSQPPTDDQVSIIVIHKDRPEFLNIQLQSIAVCSSNNNYECIVVDNGSTRQEAHDYLDDLQSGGDCRVIKNKENLFWTKAANIGAKAANKSSRYLIFMHDDVVIENPSWIDMMINVSDGSKSGHVGISSHSYQVDNQQMGFIEEWCMLVTRECWEECGPFEEQLPIVGAPFIFTLRTKFKEFNPQIMQMKIAHHYARFSIEVSDWEEAGREARAKIPGLMVKASKK